MKKLMILLLTIAFLLTGCGNGETKETLVEESLISKTEIETEEKTFQITETQSETETFDSRKEELSEEKILLSYDEKGEYGQYDLFDGEPYLRYYVPIGNYKVKCNIRGGFYIETIELHKEDGWDTATTIEQIMMEAGEEREIAIEEGQCISLIINTEIELTNKEQGNSGENNDSEYYNKGKEIGEKLNEEMEDIDWEENYDQAEDAGEKAAEWLNKLFE